MFRPGFMPGYVSLVALALSVAWLPAVKRPVRGADASAPARSLQAGSDYEPNVYLTGASRLVAHNQSAVAADEPVQSAPAPERPRLEVVQNEVTWESLSPETLYRSKVFNISPDGSPDIASMVTHHAKWKQFLAAQVSPDQFRTLHEHEHAGLGQRHRTPSQSLSAPC